MILEDIVNWWTVAFEASSWRNKSFPELPRLTLFAHPGSFSSCWLYSYCRDRFERKTYLYQVRTAVSAADSMLRGGEIRYLRRMILWRITRIVMISGVSTFLERIGWTGLEVTAHACNDLTKTSPWKSSALWFIIIACLRYASLPHCSLCSVHRREGESSIVMHTILVSKLPTILCT